MVHRHEVPEKKRFPAMILVVIVQNHRRMWERCVAVGATVPILRQLFHHVLYPRRAMVLMSRTTGENRAGCSKRPSSKAAASEEAKAYASVR